MLSRIDKLRALADHPTANAGERANALAEIARLKSKGVKEAPPPLSWLDVGLSRDFEEFERNFREMNRRTEERLAEVLGPVEYAVHRATMAAHAAKRAWADEEIRRYPRGERLRADVARWMASLRIGDKVRTLHDVGAYDGPPLPSQVLIVERRTPSGIVVCTDGSKWNVQGYQRGEMGSNGLRTFIVAVT